RCRTRPPARRRGGTHAQDSRRPLPSRRRGSAARGARRPRGHARPLRQDGLSSVQGRRHRPRQPARHRVRPARLALRRRGGARRARLRPRRLPRPDVEDHADRPAHRPEADARLRPLLGGRARRLVRGRRGRDLGAGSGRRRAVRADGPQPERVRAAATGDPDREAADGDPILDAAIAQAGKLLRVTGRETWQAVADVGAFDYDWTATTGLQLDPQNPEFPDANPYGVLSTPSGVYVVDGGSNTLDLYQPWNGSLS